jgi:carbamoyl-phosphate synthase small subunit
VKKAHLVLADGTVFAGEGIGAGVVRSGEVVFNTSITGYQEILTDPSYQGQIVVMTYPEIGNYGVTPADDESRRLFLSGFVVRELSPIVSNYRARGGLDDYLRKARVPGIAEIDTRALVRRIRDGGSVQAVLAVGGKIQLSKLKKMARELPGMEGQNLAAQVSCTRPYTFTKGLENFVKNQPMSRNRPRKRCKVAAYDYGIKRNILRLLTEHGCDVTVVPYGTRADKILDPKARFDGVFLSNGPGDPAVCHEAIENVTKILGKKPVFGICLGHQILALALGASTYKLKFGHHGGNQPVMDLTTRKVEITAQNHGFAVDDKTLPRHATVTHINLNDHTVEGIAHEKLGAFSVQYHPEAAPGPHDSRYLFERFIGLMERA